MVGYRKNTDGRERDIMENYRGTVRDEVERVCVIHCLRKSHFYVVITWTLALLSPPQPLHSLMPDCWGALLLWQQANWKNCSLIQQVNRLSGVCAWSVRAAALLSSRSIWTNYRGNVGFDVLNLHKSSFRSFDVWLLEHELSTESWVTFKRRPTCLNGLKVIWKYVFPPCLSDSVGQGCQSLSPRGPHWGIRQQLIHVCFQTGIHFDITWEQCLNSTKILKHFGIIILKL